MIMTVIALSIVASSLLLAFTCTEREYFSCIQSPKTKSAKESTINSYAWYLQAIPSKFSYATFQNFQLLLILCHCF
jgi:hypothetical protein